MILFLFSECALFGTGDNWQPDRVSEQDHHNRVAYQQHDGVEPVHCGAETNVKTRFSSSHTDRQTQSIVQSNTSSDVDIDGPPADDLDTVHNSDLELYDFRSTDGRDSTTSTGRSSPVDPISLLTDENNTMSYGNILSGTSLSDGMLHMW